MNMLQMSEAMRDGRSISLKSQTQLIIALSIPAILEQLVMTLMSYIDTAMVGSLGPGATAAIGVVASSIWLMNGLTSAIAVGFSVQIAQYLGAGRDGDSRNVLCSPSCLTFCSVWSWPQQPSASGRSCRSFWALIRRSPRRPGPTSVRWPSSSVFHGLRPVLQHPAVQRKHPAAQHHERGHVRV